MFLYKCYGAYVNCIQSYFEYAVKLNLTGDSI